MEVRCDERRDKDKDKEKKGEREGERKRGEGEERGRSIIEMRHSYINRLCRHFYIHLELIGYLPPDG